MQVFIMAEPKNQINHPVPPSSITIDGVVIKSEPFPGSVKMDCGHCKRVFYVSEDCVEPREFLTPIKVRDVGEAPYISKEGLIYCNHHHYEMSSED